MANNRKLHWNYSHNYFKIELRPITGEMKCRWHRDSVLIRHNGRQNFWHWVSGFCVLGSGFRDSGSEWNCKMMWRRQFSG